MGRRDHDHGENQTALFNNSPTHAGPPTTYYVTTTDRSTLPLTTDQGLKVKQHWGLWCSFAFNNSGVHAAHSRAVAFTRGRSRERVDSLWEIAGFHFPLFSKGWSSTWSHHEDCNAYMDMILLLVMIIQFSSSLKNAKNPAIPTFQHSSSNTLKNTLRQIQRSPIYGRTKSIIQYDFRKVYRLVYKNSEENYANSWGIVVAESKVSSLA